MSTLEAMAESLGIWEGTVVPTMDARRAQTYTAVFQVQAGKITRLEEDMAISYAELGEKIKNCQKPIFLVGDGAEICYNTLKETVPGLVLPPEHRRHQRAIGVALVAEKILATGERPRGEALKPNYLRLSQAERERLEKQKKE